jgi:hypothetical protein
MQVLSNHNLIFLQMRIRFFTFIFFTFLFVKVNAEKVKGLIIFNNDSIAHVTFATDDFQSIQFGIKYYDSSGNEVKLSPESAKEIQFRSDYGTIRMISCINNLKLSNNIFWSHDKIFLRLKTDGKLRLYSYYYTQTTPAMPNGAGGTINGSAYGAERYILQKNNGELFKPRWLRFRKDMGKYLSDCPSVVSKINDRTYTNDLIDIIIMEYNSCKFK